MIGGIQRWSAISKINAMNQLTGRKIVNRKCAVYDKELTRSAALDLARQHNEYNSIHRTTSFPEVAACCRRLLFSHFAGDGVSDDGSTDLDVPRYNKTAYRVFKQECLTFLMSSQTVCMYVCMTYSADKHAYFIESSNDRPGHSDGIASSQHLSQHAIGLCHV